PLRRVADGLDVDGAWLAGLARRIRLRRRIPTAVLGDHQEREQDARDDPRPAWAAALRGLQHGLGGVHGDPGEGGEVHAPAGRPELGSVARSDLVEADALVGAGRGLGALPPLRAQRPALADPVGAGADAVDVQAGEGRLTLGGALAGRRADPGDVRALAGRALGALAEVVAGAHVLAG